MRNTLIRLEAIANAFATIFKRRKSKTVDSLDSLSEFTASRAAFIAQKTMYGYTKARMGTRFPEMFRDPNIIHSVNIAKMHHFAACLSDLSIFVTSRALADPRFTDKTRRALADHMFTRALNENLDHSVDEFDPAEAQSKFKQRVAFTNWAQPISLDDFFVLSPQSIIRWAPIAEPLKARDREFVENSVRYSWIEISRVFKKCFQAEKTRTDILASDLAIERTIDGDVDGATKDGAAKADV
ncbi:MAG: hypothetical protein HOH04_02970 [Rhodospirillaceae bacterium]|nr:hypothetical protein [Rhodospirillaceae bacterium]